MTPVRPTVPPVGALVAVLSISQLCRVVEPGYTVMPVDPASNHGDECTQGVHVQSVAGGDPWWAALEDLAVVTSLRDDHELDCE